MSGGAAQYAFGVCFYLLDHCFWSHPDREAMMHKDDLGILLGEMDPEHPFFETNSMPVDPAVLADWLEICPQTPETDSEWLFSIYRFLDEYERHEGFAFPLAKPMLRDADVLAYLPEAKEKACGLCARYGFAPEPDGKEPL